MHKHFVITLMAVCALLVTTGTPVHAVSDNVVISRVQAGATGNSSGEFVQLYNNSLADVDITGWKLIVDTKVIATFDMGIKARSHVLLSHKDAAGVTYIENSDGFFPEIAKSNVIVASSGHLQIVDADNQVVDELQWGSAHAMREISTTKVATRIVVDQSTYQDTDVYQDDFELLLYEDPIGGGAYDIVQEPDVPEPEVPVIEYSPLWISELLPNPGSPLTDADDEFIELFNPNDTPVNTEGYVVSAGLNGQYRFVLPSYVILPQSYLVLYASETKLVLANSTSKASIETPDGNFIFMTAPYDSVGEDQSWSLIGAVWMYSDKPTPGALNEHVVEIEESQVETKVLTASLSPCPEGKYRNPETNRCRNIETAVASLAPCDEDEEMNLQTNRCRKVATLSAVTSPCNAGYERNSETNRCRKIASEESSLKPCEPGQERNPETNRCRKVISLATVDNESKAESDTASQPSGFTVNYWVVGAAVSGVVLYGVYEWRREIIGLLSKLKARVSSL